MCPEPLSIWHSSLPFKHLFYQPRNSNWFWGCINHNSLPKRRGLCGREVRRVARPREQGRKGNHRLAACDSSVMLQLVSLLITFTFCQQRIPAQEAGGGRALRQGLEHISLLHLVVLPSVKEKLILTVWNLLIQAICQRTRLHLVPLPSIYRGCFSKHCLKAVFAPKLILCGIIEYCL